MMTAEALTRPAFEGRAHISEHLDLVLMRHHDLRKSPNPSASEWTKFAPLARRAAYKCFKAFEAHWRAFGYDVDDIHQLAQVHLVNYLGRFAGKGSNAHHEQCICIRFLGQRLREACSKIQRLGRERCTATPETRSWDALIEHRERQLATG